MIRLIETKNFRSLKYISQPLGDFHVLVGANASGKTTFLDVITFLADLVTNGIDYAVLQRTRNYFDLTFAGKGGDIEFAIEVEIPRKLKLLLPTDEFDRIRYEVRFGLTPDTREHIIFEERVFPLQSVSAPELTVNASYVQEAFPEYKPANKLVVGKYFKSFTLAFIHRTDDGTTNIYPETARSGDAFWNPALKINVKKSALGNIPADVTKFPVSLWLKEFLNEGVQMFILDSLHIRQASSPGQSLKFKTDGSNLPWVIENLKRKDMDAYLNWVKHIQTALPDIVEINTVERADDRHRYLKITYANGIEVPSWFVSDGTLRLLALTLPAYLPDFDGVYLIEEPENGIHPKAIETVFQSLSSVYNAQILLASHSPVVLSMVALKDVLCFAKTHDGVTDIINGDKHPMLRNWKGETNLSVLFAGGVLS